MIFLSLLFITLYLASLFKGNLFYNSAKQSIELEIKKFEGTLKHGQYNEQITKLIPIFLFQIIWVILLIVFYLFALEIEQMKYLTLIMIAYVVFNVVKNIVKKKSHKTDEEKIEFLKRELYTMKNRTFKGTIINALHLFYFCLAFYTLVFK
jgi:hypothetical protein